MNEVFVEDFHASSILDSKPRFMENTPNVR